MSRDALVAVREVQHPCVLQGPSEGAQVRFLGHSFGVLVRESDGWGEGGAELDQVDPVRLLGLPDGLRGIGRHQRGGGHPQRAGERVQGFHAESATLLGLAYRARRHACGMGQFLLAHSRATPVLADVVGQLRNHQLTTSHSTVRPGGTSAGDDPADTHPQEWPTTWRAGTQAESGPEREGVPRRSGSFAGPGFPGGRQGSHRDACARPWRPPGVPGTPPVTGRRGTPSRAPDPTPRRSRTRKSAPCPSERGPGSGAGPQGGSLCWLLRARTGGAVASGAETGAGGGPAGPERARAASAGRLEQHRATDSARNARRRERAGKTAATSSPASTAPRSKGPPSPGTSTPCSARPDSVASGSTTCATRRPPSSWSKKWNSS